MTNKIVSSQIRNKSASQTVLKHLLLLMGILYLTTNGYPQSCIKYQCSNCQITVTGYQDWVNGCQDCPKGGCAYGENGSHKWNRIGIDYECQKQAKAKDEANAEFERKKEKIKNGQTV